MKLHGNATLSWHGRRRLVHRVVVEGWTLTAAAEAAGESTGKQGQGVRSADPRNASQAALTSCATLGCPYGRGGNPSLTWTSRYSRCTFGRDEPMRRARLSRLKNRAEDVAAASHPRLLIERTGCGPPSPLPATLASLRARAIAFCNSFTFLSLEPQDAAWILASGEDEPVRWARPRTRKHAAAL